MLRKLLSFSAILVMQVHIAIAGTISGFITDEATSLPVSGCDLNLYDADWNYVDIDATSDSGNYTFYNVPAGTYYVKANPKYPLHYLHEYWDNSPNRDGAVTISVSEGQNVMDIDFQLSAGNYIGGKIVDENFNAIPDIDLNVYDMDWHKMDVDAESDFLGRYFVGGLPAGQYYVMANPIYAQPFIDQYWDHSNGPAHAVAVTVTPPNDTSGIDFQLISGTYIEGTVKDSVTQAPVSGILMKAYNSSGSKMRVEGRTHSDGHYVLGAYKPGDYYVRADPAYPKGYMDMYYPNAFTFDSAAPVTLALPKPVTGIDFQLPAGSYIRGGVRDTHNIPIPDIKMKFYDSDWNLLELAVSKTKSDGTFLSGALKPGSYYIKAVPVYPQPYVDEFYNDAVEKEDADPVMVTLDHEVSGIDFILESGGYLSGIILDSATGNPLYDIDLDLYDSDWQWVDYSDHSDTHGRFLIGALPFGEYYLKCDPSLHQGYIPEFFDNAFWPADADLILLTASANVTDLDFQLDHGAKITGRITDSSTGVPLSDIPVEVYSESWEILPIHAVKSSHDGVYTSHGIPTGSYFVKAAPKPEANYSAEYYFDSATRAGATIVIATVGSTTSGIDFTLDYTGPTPTPPVSLGVKLDMPARMYRPGDLFYLNAVIYNPGNSLGELPLLVVLDVLGEYYFWPGWKHFDPPEQPDIDFSFISVINGSQIVPIISAFNWPDIQTEDVTGLYFFGALTNREFTELVGSMDAVAFGYGG